MISTHQTKQQTYIKIDNKYEPYNCIPVGSIKCIECARFFPKEQLQKHLATHIDPTYIKTAPALGSTPQKINLSSLLQDPQKTQEIWVKSMMPDDLPRPQIQRKKIKRPTGQYAPLINDIHRQDKILNPDSNKDIQSVTSDTYESVEKLQDQLKVKSNIKLARSKNQIQKKHLHVYMNQNTGVANIDLIRSKRKQLPDSTQTETSQKQLGAYNVQEAPNVTSTRQKLGSSKAVNKATYDIEKTQKHPAYHLQISTLSKQIEPQKSRIGSRSRTTVVESQNPDQNQRLTCPCCKGFYCNYCKSAIPPIYRPVPDSQGNYHFHPQQYERGVQFYKQQYYPRHFSDKVCTECDKTKKSSIQDKSLVNRYVLENSPAEFKSPSSTRLER